MEVSLVNEHLNQVNTILTRLERVERENKWMKQIGGFALVVLLSVPLLGQAASKNIVKAEEFVLVDKDGKERAVLGTGENDLFNMLRGREVGPHLVLIDKDGKRRIELALWPEGSPSLFLMDRNGEPRASLAVGPDGLSRLILLDEDGDQLFEMPRSRDLEFADPPDLGP